MTVLNGIDIESQSPGRWTSFQPNGKAVVDYAIMSTNATKWVDKMVVALPTSDPGDDWADHMALVLTVLKPKESAPEIPRSDTELPQGDVALNWICRKIKGVKTNGETAFPYPLPGEGYPPHSDPCQ
jgi:hypothetical protein